MNATKLVRIALLGAILVTAQVALSFIPNVELVSLLILVTTLVFGKDALYAIIVFVLVEGLIWGFGIWWFGYLYIWPILYFLITFLKKYNKENDFVFWAFVLGFFGLAFGALYAVSYIPVSFSYALTYWFAGVPFDLIHGIGNVILTLIIGKTLYKVLIKIKAMY